MGSNSMFRYADGVDKLLMFFGTLGSLGDGLQNPLMMYVLSDVINAYGDKNSILTKHIVNKVRTCSTKSLQEQFMWHNTYTILLEIAFVTF